MCLTFFGVKYLSKLLFVVDKSLIGFFFFHVVTVFESMHAGNREGFEDQWMVRTIRLAKES